MKLRAVVLLSGGMDSTTALAQAREDGYEDIFPISLRYGSKHEVAEVAAAGKVAQYYRLSGNHMAFQLNPGLFNWGVSALVDKEVAVPDEHYKEWHKDGPSVTVVPFRNANLIAAATSIAVGLSCSAVYMAAHANDAKNWAYPDCTPEFLGAMANAVYVGTMHAVRLVFPFVWMTKAAIVRRAAELEVPLHLTWSCYNGREKHCGTCPTCLERIEAFQNAMYKDPVPYEREPMWAPILRDWPTGGADVHNLT